MKVNRREIIKALSVCKKLNKKTSMTILGSVLVMDKKIVITNLDTTIIVDTDIEGKFLIPVVAMKALKQYRDELVDIEMDNENEKININGEFMFDVQNIDQFPLMPDRSGFEIVAIISEEKKNLLFSLAGEYTDERHASVMLRNGVFYCTDTSRVLRVKADRKYGKRAHSFKAKDLKTILAYIDGDIIISVSGKTIVIEGGNAKVFLHETEQDLDIERVFHKTSDLDMFEVNVALLQEVLKKASIYENDMDDCYIKDGVISKWGDSFSFKSKKVFPAEINVRVNDRALLQDVSHIVSRVIKVGVHSVEGKSKSIILYDENMDILQMLKWK